jgi:hypothetical protein
MLRAGAPNRSFSGIQGREGEGLTRVGEAPLLSPVLVVLLLFAPPVSAETTFGSHRSSVCWRPVAR